MICWGIFFYKAQFDGLCEDELNFFCDKENYKEEGG